MKVLKKIIVLFIPVLLFSCSQSVEIQPMPAPWIMLDKSSENEGYIFTDDTVVMPISQGLTGWNGIIYPKIFAPNGIKEITIKKNGEPISIPPLLDDRINYEYAESFNIALRANFDTCVYEIEAVDFKSQKTSRKVRVMFSINGQRPSIPVVSFGAVPVTTNVNVDIQFYSYTTNGSTYLWNFGDDSTSTVQHPKHKYLKAGKYTVTLTARNYLGESYLTKTDYITATVPSNMVADNEGNVYTTKTIGTQTWMTANLRATKFRNGNPIKLETDDNQWCITSVPAYSYPGNANKVSTSGCLYNHNAVTDVRGIAPASWHVATQWDWWTLQNYLIASGYNYDGTTTGNKIAKSMATATGWDSSVTPGSVGNTDYPAYRNKSGFNALPAGARVLEYNGGFAGEGSMEFWWTSDVDANNYGYVYFIGSEDSKLNTTSYDRHNGFSVRCVKD